MSNSTAVLTDAFPPARLAFGIGLNITSGALSSLLGPLVGGVLVDRFGWRSLFLANLLLGLLALGLGWGALRTTHRPSGRREPYDVPGSLLSCAGLAAVLFTVNQMSVWGPLNARVLLLLLAGCAALVAFWLVERRAPAPLLDLALVAGRRAFRYLASFFAALAFSAVLVLVVLFRQLLAGASATAAGVVVVPMGVAMLLVVTLWTGSSYVASGDPDAHHGFAVAALVLTACGAAGAACAALQPPGTAIDPLFDPTVVTRKGDEPWPIPTRS